MLVDRARVAAALPLYELGPQLGQGNFGLVLKGRHRHLKRAVAIKVLSGQKEDAPADFAAEARVLAGFDHPHIVRVHDYNEADGLCLIVMELLAGGTLAERRKGMSAEAACAVGLAVADALACAHARGVLHRDIKPQNVLFDEASTAKVVDFGIAKILEGTAVTASGLAGTPLYMAPEQIRGGKLAPATDLYGLGVMLYELLSGAPPFDRHLPLLALYQCHLDTEPPKPAGVPGPLAQVVMKALAKDPAARQESAHVLAIELARAARTVFGPRWTTRAGIGLRLHDEIREAADRSAHPGDPRVAMTLPPPDTASPQLRPAPAPARPVAARAAGLRPIGRVTGYTRAVRSVAFHPDGQTLAGGSVDHTVRLWDVTDRAVPSPLGKALTGHTGRVLRLVFSPDGQMLASGGTDCCVRLWDVTDRNAPRPFGKALTGHSGRVEALAFSPDGMVLASVGKCGTVRLWDLSLGARTRLLGAARSGVGTVVTAAGFSADGNLLTTADVNGTVELWDVSDPTTVRLLGQKGRAGSEVLAVAFAPDGRTLATAGADGTAQLWNVASRSALRMTGPPLTGHTGPVSAVAFADARLLASAGSDQTLILWDVSDRSAPRRLAAWPNGHHSGIWQVVFAPDGQMLASAGADSTVRLWEVGAQRSGASPSDPTLPPPVSARPISETPASPPQAPRSPLTPAAIAPEPRIDGDAPAEDGAGPGRRTRRGRRGGHRRRGGRGRGRTRTGEDGVEPLDEEDGDQATEGSPDTGRAARTDETSEDEGSAAKTSTG